MTRHRRVTTPPQADGRDDDAALLDPEALFAAHQRVVRLRLRAVLFALAACCACSAMSATLGDHVAAFSRGEIDWRGQRRFEPVHPVDRRALAAIDMHAVHTRLLPGWVIAQARSVTPEGAALAHRAFDELRRAVAPDANLSALLDALQESLADDDLVGERRRIEWLVWAYDEYLDRAGVPYRIEAGLRDSHRRGALACDQGPARDLHARAADEARRLFGALPDIDTGLPERVHFLARRRATARARRCGVEGALSARRGSASRRARSRRW